MTSPAVSYSITWLQSRGVSVPPNLRAGMIKAKLIHSREVKAAGDYAAIRDELWNAVYEGVSGYLGGDSRSTAFKSAIKQAIIVTYTNAADTAWKEGGSELPIDDETNQWITGEMNAQVSYVDSLFSTLNSLRKEGDADPDVEGMRRADNWCNFLDGFYNQVKLAGAGNKMLTFTKVRDTNDSCDSCVSLRGQRHRASWWIAHDYVPPSGGGLDCGAGGHCGDALLDDDGDEFTI